MKNIFKLFLIAVLFSAVSISGAFAICDKAYNDNLPDGYEWYLISSSRTAQQLLSAKATYAVQFCTVKGNTITLTIDNMKDGASIFRITDVEADRKVTITMGKDNVAKLLNGEALRPGQFDSIKMFVVDNKLHMGFLIVPPQY
ncbi:MAG: hypothetical protein LBH40_05910 [Alphaproteobacteria bacterium]|jgi:hypothetical protein|nr:hypothetical protein [Alphaproteobacteria bacterium]